MSNSNSLYHRWGSKDRNVSIDKLVTDNDVIAEEFTAFPTLGINELVNQGMGDRVALFTPNDEFIHSKGRFLFTSGVEVYVVNLDMDKPENWFIQKGSNDIKNGLRPELESDETWQNEHLWNYLEWRILQVPRTGLFTKGREITGILKVLVEAQYLGNLDPATRKIALGQMLNTLRMQGSGADFQTLARSQWIVAKEEFIEERGLTEDEFQETKIKNRQDGIK